MDNDFLEDHTGGRAPTAFEKSVAEALMRVDPPEGFAQRVLARTAQQQETFPVTRRSGVLQLFRMTKPIWRLGSVAMLIAIAAGDIYVRQERTRTERQKTILAQQQFDEALRLTGHALDQVAVQLQQQPAGSLSRLLQNRE